MIQFLDTNSVPLSSLSMAFESGTDTQFSIKVDCRAGYYLSASDVPAELTVFARFQGDTVWTNIGSSPLNLTPYDAQRKTIEVKFTAGSVSAVARRQLKLSVSR